MKIDAIMTCNKFWKRFAACAPYWENAANNVKKNCFKIHVGHPAFRPPLEKIPKGIFEYHMLPDVYPNGSKVESKPAMLKILIDSMRKNPPTYVLFTDADIIPPPDLFEAITSNSVVFWVANRVDLDQVMTEAFLKSGNLPSDDVLNACPLIPKKVGMGWFQLVRWEALSAVYPHLRWDTVGYDKFDYSLWQELNKRFGSRKLRTKRPFVHLWHGDPGSTWQGTEKDW
jgi:hypothetical protein